MKKLTPLALSVTLALGLSAAHANDAAALLAGTQPAAPVDDGLAAGLDMMLQNTNLLRNGDNVWQRVREGFQMEEVNPELVRRHERYFSSRGDYFRRTLDRSRKYLFHIMNEVERRGMPTELALLPVVESSFVATANSPVGASGLWQFMPATGRQYGLEQTWWYDGRRDVVESTRAALDYLQNLYTMFGDWRLALAAYNWGEGNLSRAIAKVRARGEVETYENIQMPAETRNYVPKLLAVRNLMQAPERFGLKLDVLPNKPSFVAVSTGKHMNIDVAAKLAEMSVSEFKDLNPAFNLPVYAHKPGRQMLLPATKLHRFETNLAKWDKPLLTWQVYVPEGDTTPSALAEQFAMNTGELLNANNLKTAGTLPAGRPVLVALRNNQDAPAIDSTDIPSRPAEADTLVAFAATGTPGLSTPATAEPVAPATPPAISSASVPAATLAASNAAPAAAPTPLAATVAANTEAAKAVAVTKPVVIVARTEAATKPAIKPDVIRIEREPIRAEIVKVALPSSDGNTLASPDRVVAPVAALHTVASGDTLYNISRRYGMTVADLKQLNSLNEDVVKLGQTLKVIGTVTATAPVEPSALRTVAYTVKQPAQGPVPVDYVVQRGDTVFSIARKFSVSHTDILRWNNPSELGTLQPGQKVRVMQAGL